MNTSEHIQKFEQEMKQSQQSTYSMYNGTKRP